MSVWITYSQDINAYCTKCISVWVVPASSCVCVCRVINEWKKQYRHRLWVKVVSTCRVNVWRLVKNCVANNTRYLPHHNTRLVVGDNFVVISSSNVSHDFLPKYFTQTLDVTEHSTSQQHFPLTHERLLFHKWRDMNSLWPCFFHPWRNKLK